MPLGNYVALSPRVATYTACDSERKSRRSPAALNSTRFLLACALVWSAVGFLLPGRVVAAEESRDLNAEFFIRTWTTEQGLPHNSIGCLGFDQKRYLWLGTPAGLSRFDGLQFTEYPLKADHQNSGANIRAIAPRKSGTLLLPTSGEIIELTEGHFRVHPASNATNGLRPSQLYQARDGAVWIYFSGREFLRWTTSSVERYPVEIAPQSFQAASFAEDGEGNLWIAVEGFIGRYSQGRLTTPPEFANRPGEGVALTADTHGAIWLCVGGEIIRCAGPDREVIPLRPIGGSRIPFETPVGLCADRSGQLWIAAGRSGLFVLRQGRLIRVALPPVSVTSVREGPEGDIWVGTNGNGLMQLRPKTYRLFNARAGLLQNNCSSVVGDGAGGVWLSNGRGGLYEVAGASPRQVIVRYGDTVLDISTATFDADGNLWCGNKDGLFRQSPAFTGPVEKMPSPASRVSLLYRAKNGEVWFGSHVGEFGFYRHGELHLFTSADGYDGEAIRALAESPDGRVWAGEYGGKMYRSTRDTLQPFRVDHPVHDILFDGRGDMWVATAGGLLRHKQDGEFQTFTRAHGLADNILGRLLEDDRGNLWLSSRRGFFRVALEELRALAAGKVSSVHSIPFGHDQGLSGLAALNNYSPSSHRSADGQLWYATASGVVAIDPKSSMQTAAPDVLLDGVRVNDVDVSPANVVIPPGPHRVDFKFSIPSYGDSESVRVRYRLEGAHPGWKDALKSREVTYSGLATGEYRFQLQSGNADGVWNPAQPAVSFVVQPSWWQRPAVWSSGTLVFAAAGVLLFRQWSHRQYRRRLRALEQENHLERERMRIARDLHDDLGGNITAINLLAERLRQTAPAEHAPDLAQLGERSRHLSAELHSIIWMMRPNHGTVTEFADYVEKFCSRFLATPAAHLTVTSQVESDRTLATDLQHHLFSIIKEAVMNARKHAQAERISIRIAAFPRRLEIFVEDNGRGFDPASPDMTHGNGLDNMRARALEIGGEVLIESVRNKGTRIAVSLQLPAIP